jgi:hypothetical protein
MLTGVTQYLFRYKLCQPVKHDNTVCYTLLLFAASGHLDII